MFNEIVNCLKNNGFKKDELDIKNFVYYKTEFEKNKNLVNKGLNTFIRDEDNRFIIDIIFINNLKSYTFTPDILLLSKNFELLILVRLNVNLKIEYTVSSLDFAKCHKSEKSINDFLMQKILELKNILIKVENNKKLELKSKKDSDYNANYLYHNKIIALQGDQKQIQIDVLNNAKKLYDLPSINNLDIENLPDGFNVRTFINNEIKKYLNDDGSKKI